MRWTTFYCRYKYNQDKFFGFRGHFRSLEASDSVRELIDLIQKEDQVLTLSGSN